MFRNSATTVLQTFVLATPDPCLIQPPSYVIGDISQSIELTVLHSLMCIAHLKEALVLEWGNITEPSTNSTSQPNVASGRVSVRTFAH